MKTTSPLRTWKLTCLLVAVVVPFPAVSHAGVKHWQGDVNGNWNTAGNWLENAVPAAGDELNFSAATRYTITNDISGLRLDRLSFTDGGYIVRGNGVTVTNGLVSAPSAPATGNELQIDLTLGASQTFRCDRTNLYFAGQISLGANTLTVTNPAGTEIIIGAWAGTGLISGTGGITKDGAGTLNFAGWSVANTYSGPTYVKNGTLLLGRTTVPSIPGPGTLTIGDGTGAAGSAVVRYYANTGQIGTTPIVINADGLLDLADSSDTVGNSLTLSLGGSVQTGAAGNLLLAANSTITVSGHCYIWGNLNIASGTCTIQSPASGYLYLYATVSGSANIVKNANAFVILYASNTFTGTFTANTSGYVYVRDPRALGTASGGTVVNDSAYLLITDGIDVTDEALTMNSTDIYALAVMGATTNTWSGPITLSRDTSINTPTNGVLVLSTGIGGAGGITKRGPGTLLLAGSTHNSYGGNTYVNEGVLDLHKTTGYRAIPNGVLQIGDGVGGDRADVVLYACGDDGLIGSSVSIVVTNSGLLDLNGHDETVGAITLAGGDLTLGIGTLTLGGNITVLSSSSVINGPGGTLNLPATRTIDVANGVFFDLQAPVAGAGGITKAGPGDLRLGYPNTYSGLTIVQRGMLEPWTALSLGSTGSGTVVSNGASLVFVNAIGITNEALMLNGPGVPGYGALDSEAAGTSIWAGPVTLNADSTIVPYPASSTWRIIGPIGGLGGLTQFTSGGTNGTLILEGNTSNTYGGTTWVNSGTLLLGKTGVDQAIPGDLIISGTVRLLDADQISNNADVTINSSGALYLKYYPEGIAGLNGSGCLELGYSGLDVGYNNASGTFSGVVAGAPVDEAGLRKVAGNGTITLTGTNTYRGITCANSGTLLVTGYQPQSPVTVGSGGIFGGTGTVGNITANGKLRPGTSPGLMTSSNLSFSGTGNYSVELNGTAPGTGYDQIKARGSVSLGSASLNAALGFPSAISNSFTIIDNDGSDAVSGTFAGLAEGATGNISGTPFRISYIGGSGNDVVLTQLTATQRPLLRIATANATNVVLSWPTNFTGYSLESNTNLNGSLWSPVSSTPVWVDTNNFVTNPPTGNRFYRLTKP